MASPSFSQDSGACVIIADMLCICYAHESLDPILLEVLHLVKCMHVCVVHAYKLLCIVSCSPLFCVCKLPVPLAAVCDGLGMLPCLALAQARVLTPFFTSNIFTTLLVLLVVVTD